MLDLQSVYFGQKHKDFDYRDFDLIKKIQRLARKHQRQCENGCNGVGYVNSQCYYSGTIDEWSKREYGANVKSAYIDNTEESIFDKEARKIEEKIVREMDSLNQTKYVLWLAKPFKVKLQGDPRGNTVNLYYEGDFIEL